jgi:hypothetical protein
MSQTRLLAAILAADVLGYLRQMGASEEITLERLKLNDLTRPSRARRKERSRAPLSLG